MVETLVDTTFFLSTVGVAVKEIRTNDLQALKVLSRKVRLHGSYVSFIELFGKLGRRFRAADVSSVRLGIRSLLESGTYPWVGPTPEALQFAFELRTKGHRDNIDNILYSIALVSRMFFLSLDKDFKRFLQEHGYDAGTVVGVQELAARIS